MFADKKRRASKPAVSDETPVIDGAPGADEQPEKAPDVDVAAERAAEVDAVITPPADPLAAVAIPSAEAFAAEVAAAAAPPPPEILAPIQETVAPTPNRAPRVRVLEKKVSFQLGGTRFTFVKGQVLDKNHYDDRLWPQLLEEMMTEPVTE